MLCSGARDAQHAAPVCANSMHVSVTLDAAVSDKSFFFFLSMGVVRTPRGLTMNELQKSVGKEEVGRSEKIT